MISRAEQPNAQADYTNSIARMAMIPGEPVRAEKLVRANQGGVMSALLPAGSRALAITIDNRGANTAGGFILPNDRVDVIRISRDEAASKAQGTDVFVSDTLLRNVRVLAIGQNIQERNGEKVVVGETATLELDPRQVEVSLPRPAPRPAFAVPAQPAGRQQEGRRRRPQRRRQPDHRALRHRLAAVTDPRCYRKRAA